MTTMFFAGIPLEGSGARPLEADLYGAEQQGVEHENLSATGNLNVGVVIQYDEHAQRFLSGGSKGDDSLPNAAQGSIRAMSALLPTFDAAGHTGGTAGSDNSGIMQTTTLTTPSSQTIELPTQSQVSAPLSPATSVEASHASTNTSSTESSAQNFTHHGVSESGNGYTIYNTYDTTNYNITNNDINYTQNNYYEGGAGGPGGPGGMPGCEGGGPGNTLNMFVTNEINLTNTIATETINNITTIIGGNDSLIGDVITLAGNSITGILGITGNTIGGAETLVSDILGSVNTITNTTDGILSVALGSDGLITQTGNVVNSAVDHITSDLTGAAGSLLSATSPILNVTDTLLSNNSIGDIAPVADTLLSGNTLGDIGHVATSIITPVNDNSFALADSLVTLAGNTVSVPVSLLNNDSLALGSLPGTPGSMAQDISHTIQDVTQGIATPFGNTGNELFSGVTSLASNAPSLLDANTSVLSTPLPEASGALVNANTSLLSETNMSPQAGNSGLINVDSSLLSTPQGSSNAGDGVSLLVNPNAVVQSGITNGSIITPEINVPLPASQSVPIVSSAASTVMETGNTVNETAGSLNDPLATLSALTDTSHTIAAVDTGVLFTGGTATVGHDTSSTTSASHDTLHVGSLIHSTLLGLH